jgi:predicted fused transcriptional regulator/phosphomethylpyrimidine kinase
MVLDHREREIVLRTSLLSEPEEEISRHVAIPILQVRRTQAKARAIFNVCCRTVSNHDTRCSS